MQFEYEIPVDEYVAAQLLYSKLTQRPKLLKQAALWIAVGILFIVSAITQDAGWGPMFLALPGALCIGLGVQCLFPTWYIRRQYRGSGVAGKKFQVEVNEEGFEVVGDVCSWRVSWAGVSAKAEDKRVFSLYGANTLFMFGKKYLTDEQQRELRKLAGLPVRPV